jgi:hypothetical protein
LHLAQACGRYLQNFNPFVDMHPVTPPDLRAFLSEVVNLPPERLANVRATIKALRLQLARHVGSSEEFGLIEILNSGSVAKKTAITPLNDVDVAVLLRPGDVPTYQLPDLLKYVRDLLVTAYHPKAQEDYSITRHAVRVEFRDSRLAVDVVPIIPHPEKERFALLPTRGSGEWVLTSIPLHLEFIRECSREHPDFLELVRLVKWWRREQGVHFKSFLIELLWAHLLRTRQVAKGDLHEALLGFFGYIVRTELRETVSFDGDHERSEAASAPVRVSDPVNPSNNVAAAIDPARRDQLVRACREAFEALAAAQTAPTAMVARTNYQRVFGPRFAQPADVPGEPSTPTPEDHVRARLHSDLRQLRVLNGGFTRDTELARAQAISLWIDRGLAAAMEFAYYDPATHERVLSLRYEIDRERTSRVDSDPDSIPVCAVEGAASGMHVNGTEAWNGLKREEQDAFFEELEGGWARQELLKATKGHWSPGRVVSAHGKLTVTRSIYRANAA